jgi:tRNA G46 methylase TrmB
MRTQKYRRSQRITRKKHISKLKQLYPMCKHDHNTDDYSLYEGHKITYGEMEYKGIDQLYKYITKHYNSDINCFIDIGSGRGKLCMYMAAQPKIIDVLGVELVKQRHNDAEILKSELKNEYSSKVILLNKNVLEIDFEKYKNSQIFIWFSNLCFEQSITNVIFQKLMSELPKGTIICCSNTPNSGIGEFLQNISVPMSWSKSSNVYIYTL